MKGTRKLTLSLWQVFTAAELADKAQQLSATIKDHEETELQKAEAAKAYAEELKSLRAQMSVLGRELRERGAMRPVECVVEYHTPAVGTKRTTRLDSGECVREEAMTADEMQEHLFAEEGA